MLYGSNYYVGLSLPRLSLGGNTSQGLPNDYYLTSAYITNLGSDFKLKPSLLLSYQGTALPLEYNIAATLYAKEVLGVGISYRNDSAVAGILSVNINNNIQFGYSYQFSVGTYALGGLNNTSQELTLSYRFGKNVVTKLL